MLAVQVSRHGGPAELQPVQLDDPVAGPGEVLVRNRWVGVNYVDLQHREGQPDRARAVGAVLSEVAAGKFDPRIAGRFPLREASEAHTALASRGVLGKLLLEV